MRAAACRFILPAALLLGLGVFFADVAFPLLHLWPLYFLVLILAYRAGTQTAVYTAALTVTAFIAASLPTRPALVSEDLFNDYILPLLLLWPAAWLLAKRHETIDQLAQHGRELEAQVQARTAELRQEIEVRQRAEATLRESERRYRLLSENASDVVWTVDLEGKPTYFSPSVAKMSGFSRDQTLSFSWEERVATGVNANIKPHLQAIVAALQTGQPAPAEPFLALQTRDDGAMLWAETYIGPLYDDDGTLIGLRGTTRDVTRRQLAEEALRRSQERLDKIFRLSPGGIAIIHRDTGHYLDANQAYLEMLGLPREAVIGHTSAELGIMSQVQRNRLAAEVQARGYVRGFDTQILDARGQTVDVLYSAEQLEVDGEPYYLILTIDISRRKHMERELQQLNAELEDRVNLRTAALQEALGELQHASQLKDEFLAMISHELRTPINGVLNLAETLGDEVIGPLTPRQAQYVAGITQSGGRLLAVIDGILNYTQLLAGRVELRPEVCRVAALLDACAARQRDAAEAKQQALSVAVACQALTVVTDPRALSEVVDRLLENAVKFTPPGGQLGLTASPGAGAAVEIIVWDTGPGLTQMELAALVQPLAQADGRLARRHEGLGMGLAIAHQLLLLMGGRLEVQSEVGQGSRFVVTVGGGAN